MQDVRSEVKEGDQVLVKVVNIEPGSGKIRLSRKALLSEAELAAGAAADKAAGTPASPWARRAAARARPSAAAASIAAAVPARIAADVAAVRVAAAGVRPAVGRRPRATCATAMTPAASSESPTTAPSR